MIIQVFIEPSEKYCFSIWFYIECTEKTQTGLYLKYKKQVNKRRGRIQNLFSFYWEFPLGLFEKSFSLADQLVRNPWAHLTSSPWQDAGLSQEPTDLTAEIKSALLQSTLLQVCEMVTSPNIYNTVILYAYSFMQLDD